MTTSNGTHSMHLNRLLLPALIASLSLSLAGCGGGEASSPAPTPPASTPGGGQPVQPLPQPPSITQQPVGRADASPGQSFSWSVAAAGDGVLTYQWMRAGAPIPGATNSTYTTTALGVGDDGTDISVAVKSQHGEVISSPSRVSVTPPGDARPINACGAITGPGLYRLTADVAGQVGEACLTIAGATNVVVDCNGHSISNGSLSSWASAVRIQESTGVSLRGCKIRSHATHVLRSSGVSIADGDIGMADASQIQHLINVREVRDLHFARNKVAGYLQGAYVDGARITGNSMATSSGQSIHGVVVLNFGADNAVVANVLEGGWRGDKSLLGADDGVVLGDQTRALVADNSMANFWDAGIEWYGVLSDSEIIRNKIDNVPITAIGGWYWSSVSNTRFVGNTASRSPRMFYLYHGYCLRPAGFDELRRMPADDSVKLLNNLFEGNQLKDQVTKDRLHAVLIRPGYSPHKSQSECSSIAGERLPVKSDYQIANNLFRNNDFGRESVTFDFSEPVAASIIDGGGNVCAQAAGSPIQCKPPAP